MQIFLNFTPQTLCSCLFFLRMQLLYINLNKHHKSHHLRSGICLIYFIFHETYKIYLQNLAKTPIFDNTCLFKCGNEMKLVKFKGNMMRRASGNVTHECTTFLCTCNAVFILRYDQLSAHTKSSIFVV